MKLWLVLNTTQYFVLQSQASKKSKWNNRNQEEEDWQHNTERWIERTLAQHHRHTASAARPPSSHSSIGSTSFERSKTTHSWKFNRTARVTEYQILSRLFHQACFSTQHPRHVDIVWQVIGKAVYIVLCIWWCAWVAAPQYWLNRRLLFENKSLCSSLFCTQRFNSISVTILRFHSFLWIKMNTYKIVSPTYTLKTLTPSAAKC